MNSSKIKTNLDCAIKELIQRHKKLLELDVREPAITHKLAEILEKHFSDYDIDCEYNRHHNEVKRMMLQCKHSNIENKQVIPDIIIHKRDTDSNNLLVVEVKKEKSSNQDNDHDRNKLKAFLKPPYNYKFGVFLKLYLTGKYTAEWFVN